MQDGTTVYWLFAGASDGCSFFFSTIAHNLAWKLSFVLNGLCPDPEKLLDSYSTEVHVTTIYLRSPSANNHLFSVNPSSK